MSGAIGPPHEQAAVLRRPIVSVQELLATYLVLLSRARPLTSRSSARFVVEHSRKWSTDRAIRSGTGNPSPIEIIMVRPPADVVFSG
jgi:hypothetical protein